MIDNVASPNPAAANLLTNSAPAPTPAAGAGQGAQAASDAAPAESFATALQSRLQRASQASLNKPTPRGKAENAENTGDSLLKLKSMLQALNADKSTDKPANLVAQAALAAHEAGENPAEAVLKAIAARLAGKDKQEEADTPTSAVAGDAITALVTPLTIKTVAAPPAAPVAQPVGTKQNSARADTTLPAETPTAGEQAAILAATTDKNETAPATIDRPQDNSFADMVKNAAPAPATAVNTHAHNTAPVVREVGTPVTSPQWSSDVGNQVSWMVSQRESRADLVLNPPHLGRIEVSISMNGDQATASFVSPNADVRDALQGSLPRLREILADAGVFLGQADIGAETSRQFGSGAEKGTKSGGDSISSSNGTLLGSSSLLPSETVAGVKRGHGLIDLFA